MIPLHFLENEVINKAEAELQKGNHWIAYNRLPYTLTKSEVYFFPDRESASAFAQENTGDEDGYKIIKVSNPEDFHLRITYGYQSDNKYHILPEYRMIMNEQNVTYLKDQLRYHGFGEALYGSLEHNINQHFQEFILKHETQINNNPFTAALYFKKGDNSDRYYFNSWEGTLRTEEEKRQQTFYLNHGQGTTLKEGFNLLEGRAVQKELENAQGQKYKAWLQLDFSERDTKGNYKVKQYHPNYGYDLEKVLEALPIKELSDPQQKERLMYSLAKGNVPSVAFEGEGAITKMFITADPKFKSIKIYDAGMNLQNREALLPYLRPKQDMHPNQNQENGLNKKSEVSYLGRSAQLKKEDESLLPKRRHSRHKGLGLS